jgi:hypothetical protein
MRTRFAIQPQYRQNPESWTARCPAAGTVVQKIKPSERNHSQLSRSISAAITLGR